MPSWDVSREGRAMDDDEEREFHLEGPAVDEASGCHRYVAHGRDQDLWFEVMPDNLGGESGWGVRIEGIPGPSIVHDKPWPTVEAARDAALAAVEALFQIEAIQRADQERNQPE